eukprot:1148797-Pelagomonas_calceolata.AAC.2
MRCSGNSSVSGGGDGGGVGIQECKQARSSVFSSKEVSSCLNKIDKRTAQLGTGLSRAARQGCNKATAACCKRAQEKAHVKKGRCSIRFQRGRQ